MRKERLLPIWDRSTAEAIAYYHDNDASADPFRNQTDAKQTVYSPVPPYTPPSLESSLP